MNSSGKLEEIYRQHGRAVYRVCLRLVSRREAAEEIAAHTFLSLQQEMDHVDESSVPSWLFSTARRQAAAYWTQRTPGNPAPSTEASTDTAALWTEPGLALDRRIAACSSLKPLHRVCLTLRFGQGMEREEIARAVGLTELQIKGALHYALEQMRRGQPSAAAPHAPIVDTTDERELFALLGSPRPGCPPLDVLMAMHQEVLPAPIETAARRHLAACPLCRHLLEDLEQLTDEGLGAPEMTSLTDQRLRERLALWLDPAAIRAHAWKGRLLAFASGALLTATTFGVWHWRQSPALSPIIELTGIPHPSASVARLNIPFTPLPAPAASLATKLDPTPEELAPIFRDYAHADYPDAERALTRLAPRYPSSVLLPLYLGVSQLAQSEDQDAHTSLQHALDRSRAAKPALPEQSDEARWYLAIAAARLHSNEAISQLRTLCNHRSSPYSPQACTLLMKAAR